MSKKDEIYNRYKELRSKDSKAKDYDLAQIIAKERSVTVSYIVSVISMGVNKKEYPRKVYERSSGKIDYDLEQKFRDYDFMDMEHIIIKGLCGEPYEYKR